MKKLANESRNNKDCKVNADGNLSETGIKSFDSNINPMHCGISNKKNTTDKMRTVLFLNSSLGFLIAKFKFFLCKFCLATFSPEWFD